MLAFGFPRFLGFILLACSCGFLSACGGIQSKGSNKAEVIKKPSLLSDIPASCKDPQNRFKPTRKILSKSAYNAKAQSYQPISATKGFLTQDFNGDGKADYHFIERSGSHIRLISCLSNKNKHSRRVTPFKIHETTAPDFQTISETNSVVNNTLVLSINKHEHNWGSDSETSHYRYQKEQNNFMLVQREITSSSGDGMRSDTYEYYDLEKKRYRKSGVCGSSEEACKPYKENGRIIALDNLLTLFQSEKIYARLVPD